MKLKNMWKRFWTLDVHNHEGFTLVELIIVIAILAILSTGAIAGYSAYVESANKTADKAMIAEIENVLLMAYYNGDLTSSVYLLLNADGVDDQTVVSEELNDVMTAAYGANWETALKLKYGKWSTAHLSGLSTEMALVIQDSSYISGGRYDSLLEDVEKFTGVAQNLAGAMTNNGNLDTSLGKLFGKDLLDETAKKYGIEGPSDGDWDAWGKAHPQEFSNLLVMATALDSQKYVDSNGTSTMAESTALIQEFSSYYAFAATCPEFSKKLDEKMAELDAVDSPTAGAAWYRELQSLVNNESYKNSDEKTFAEYTKIDEITQDSDASDDQMAFLAIMSGLSNASTKDIVGDLGNDNLFTEGAVKDVFDQYMDVVGVMAGGSGNVVLDEGDVLITFDTVRGEANNTAN